MFGLYFMSQFPIILYQMLQIKYYIKIEVQIILRRCVNDVWPAPHAQPQLHIEIQKKIQKRYIFAGGLSKMLGLHFLLGHDEHKRQILRLNH